MDKKEMTRTSKFISLILRHKPGAIKAGSRHGRPFVYKVHTGDMYKDGYVFYLSENGVWLTKSVPAKYLEGITDKS